MTLTTLEPKKVETNITVEITTSGFKLTSKANLEKNQNSILGSSSCNNEFSCYNKGVCLETLSGFKCQCLPQYTGIHCESSLMK